MNYENFGNRLNKLLGTRDKSQVWLAIKIGVKESCVSGWVNNRHIPRFKVIEKISELLNVTPFYFDEYAAEYVKQYLLNENREYLRKCVNDVLRLKKEEEVEIQKVSEEVSR